MTIQNWLGDLEKAEKRAWSATWRYVRRAAIRGITLSYEDAKVMRLECESRACEECISHPRGAIRVEQDLLRQGPEGVDYFAHITREQIAMWRTKGALPLA